MIELSVMEHGREFPRLMRDLLDQFERDTKLQVNLRILSWQDAWAELVRVGLYGDGPHVSEIGSTWLSELAGMGALRPFGPYELSRYVNTDQFLPSAWSSVTVSGVAGVAEAIWALPWLTDIRLIYYRSDLFERV